MQADQKTLGNEEWRSSGLAVPIGWASGSNTPKRMKAHYSSATVEWTTPRHVFDKLDEEFRFTLDPCCTRESAKCAKHYTAEEDGLSKDWSGDRVFMNPPYGRVIGQWMRKAYESAQAGALVVCLVPARTDTAWWHDYAAKGEVRFVRGRLNFGGDRLRGHNAPFPVAIVILRPLLFAERGDRERAAERGNQNMSEPTRMEYEKTHHCEVVVSEVNGPGAGEMPELPSSEGAFPGATGSLPASSADFFYGWLRARAERIQAKAADAWKDNQHRISDYYAAEAKAVADTAEDFRTDMGLPKPRQPEENAEIGNAPTSARKP